MHALHLVLILILGTAWSVTRPFCYKFRRVLRSQVCHWTSFNIPDWLLERRWYVSYGATFWNRLQPTILLLGIDFLCICHQPLTWSELKSVNHAFAATIGVLSALNFVDLVEMLLNLVFTIIVLDQFKLEILQHLCLKHYLWKLTRVIVSQSLLKDSKLRVVNQQVLLFSSTIWHRCGQSISRHLINGVQLLLSIWFLRLL